MTVEDLLRYASQLDRAEQLRLLDSLERLVFEVPRRTIPATVLRGIGHELWDGTDAQQYVHAERDSWIG